MEDESICGGLTVRSIIKSNDWKNLSSMNLI